MAKTPRSPASASEASAADTIQGGAAGPAEDAAPRVTVDANAPIDPVIQSETEALRADAAGQASEGAEATDGASAQGESPAPDAPVTGLGGTGGEASAPLADSTSPSTLGSAYYRDTDDLFFHPLADVIVLDVDGQGGVTLDRPVHLDPEQGYGLDFHAAGGARQYRLIVNGAPAARVTTTVRVLGLPVAGSAARFGVLSVGGLSAEAVERAHRLQAAAVLGGGATAPQVFEIPPLSAPDLVPLAAPAVQPVAVVDPAFVRVVASAKVRESGGRELKINTEIRAEPDHHYGVRYVDVEGVPRIVRIEAFVGPTDTLVLAGDFLPPIKGSDVQIGALAVAFDLTTNQRLLPEGIIAMRPLDDGTANAVTVDGRKIRVGLLP